MTLSERIGDLIIVTRGLKPGERVIVEGIQKVRPGMQVKPEAAAAGRDAARRWRGDAGVGSAAAPAAGAGAPPTTPPTPPAAKPKSGG